ncbi:MAG: hypothetical protein ACYTE5_08595 [Planctomycetota bacterium]|jgi:hypothetical protein
MVDEKAAEYLQQFAQALPPYNAADCAHEARWMLDATPELRDRLLPLALLFPGFLCDSFARHSSAFSGLFKAS